MNDSTIQSKIFFLGIGKLEATHSMLRKLGVVLNELNIRALRIMS